MTQQKPPNEVHPLPIPIARVRPIDVPPPAYRSDAAVGLDLAAAIDEPLILAPGQRRLIPTGYAIAIPAGYEGQVRPRSGLALNHGITVLNTPGTIDPDYRGELKVLLINLSDQPFTIRPRDRIAQLVICPVAIAFLQWVDELDPTARGAGGYGSTGVDS